MPAKLGGDRGLPVTMPPAIGSDRVTVQQRKRVMMPEKLIIVGRVGTDLWACMKRRLEWGHYQPIVIVFRGACLARFTTAPCRLSRPRRRGAWRANAGRCRCGG